MGPAWRSDPREATQGELQGELQYRYLAPLSVSLLQFTCTACILHRSFNFDTAAEITGHITYVFSILA